MAALAQQISQWFDGTGIEVVISTRHLHDLSTLATASTAASAATISRPFVCKTASAASISCRSSCWMAWKRIVTLSLEAPDGAGSREVFYLSLAPEEGWMIRKAHQSPEARLMLTEDRFLWRSIAWPDDPRQAMTFPRRRCKRASPP
nr:hypothetical protein [Klebsiella pneumoniae subsp. pneumoniae]